MTDVLEFELEPDPGWFVLPEDDVDLEDWTVDLVRELADADSDEDAVRASAEDVLRHARAARDNAVELALVFLPHAPGPVVATCHVELVFGTAGDLPGLDEVAEALARPQGDHLGAPVVDRRLLPAGPAVRQHVLRSEGSDGAVLESVVHVAEVPGLDDALLRVTTSWRALALGDPLAERADRVAAGLVVRAV